MNRIIKYTVLIIASAQSWATTTTTNKPPKPPKIARELPYKQTYNNDSFFKEHERHLNLLLDFEDLMDEIMLDCRYFHNAELEINDEFLEKLRKLRKIFNKIEKAVGGALQYTNDKTILSNISTWQALLVMARIYGKSKNFPSEIADYEFVDILEDLERHVELTFEFFGHSVLLEGYQDRN